MTKIITIKKRFYLNENFKYEREINIEFYDFESQPFYFFPLLLQF